MHKILKVISVAFLACSMVFSQTDREAAIQNIIGSVKVRKGESNTWKDARPGMPIREKDAIRTFVESQVEIVTSEGSVVRLEENTTLEMADFKQMTGGVQKTKISILNGTVLSNVKKLLNAGSKFDFETPTATASIRGTTVGIDVLSDKTSIKVYDGEVLVMPRGTAAGISVKTNQMTTVIKGQKALKIEALTERQKRTIVNPDLKNVDTTRKETGRIDSSHSTGPLKADSMNKEIIPSALKPDSMKTAFGRSKGPFPGGSPDTTILSKQDGVFNLTITSPSDGQIFSLPMIPVSGTVSPGTEVTVNGIKCPVSSAGSFSLKVPIPDEENTIILEIEAVLKNSSRRVIRQVTYKPALTLIVNSPQNQQTVNSVSIPISGQVLPAKADLMVSETKVPLAVNGRFSGFVSIPDEEGRVDLTFESSYQGSTKNEIRTVFYKRLIDMNKPTIQPIQLPEISKIKSLSFTVFDKTPDEDITFFSSVDGSKNIESGQANSTFLLELTEGVHNYVVYAEDKAHNRTQVVSGEVKFLRARPLIQMRKPAHSPLILHIPPGTPNDRNYPAFAPVFTVEFSILNVPDNDMQLIKEASVRNELTGQLLEQRNLIDFNLDFDVDLKRGSNRLIIKIRDINDNDILYPSPVIIDVR